MDKNTMNALRAVVERGLGLVKDELNALGVAAKLGNGSYTDYNGHFKIEFNNIVNGVAKTTEAADFERYSKIMFGIPADLLGRKFGFQNRSYTVRGLRVKARKSPMLVERDDSRMFTMPVMTVKKAFNIAPLFGSKVYSEPPLAGLDEAARREEARINKAEARGS